MLDICENPSYGLDLFLQIFETVLNRHAPQKTKIVKNVLQPDWLNAEIAEAGKNVITFIQKKKKRYGQFSFIAKQNKIPFFQTEKWNFMFRT